MYMCKHESWLKCKISKFSDLQKLLFRNIDQMIRFKLLTILRYHYVSRGLILAHFAQGKMREIKPQRKETFDYLIL